MAKALKFEKHAITTRDNDGDEHEDEVVSAIVDDGTNGQEVFLRDGTARVLKTGDAVVPVGGGKHDVFSAKEWDDMWNDSERVSDHGGMLRSEKVADSKKSHQGSDGLSTFDDSDKLDDDEVSQFRAWKAEQKRAQGIDAEGNHTPESFTADTNKRPQDAVPNSPKDDVTPSPAPTKKAASFSGKRS